MPRRDPKNLYITKLSFQHNGGSVVGVDLVCDKANPSWCICYTAYVLSKRRRRRDLGIAANIAGCLIYVLAYMSTVTEDVPQAFAADSKVCSSFTIISDAYERVM